MRHIRGCEQARLAANIPWIRENLSPLSFVDVPERAYVDGILDAYELSRIELLRDLFVWASEHSCARYSAVRQSLGDPDPFRLLYRTLMAEIVAEIVRGQMDKKCRSLHQAARYGVRAGRRSGPLCRGSTNGNDEPSRGKHRALQVAATGVSNMAGTLAMTGIRTTQ